MGRYFLYNFFLKMPQKNQENPESSMHQRHVDLHREILKFLFRFLISLFLSEILYYYIYLDEDFKN